MRELVIISGKGGTGKTSITASFAILANRPVVADCDVDAADLHLILSPEIKSRHAFQAGYEAGIIEKECIACGACMAHCRFDAVRVNITDAGKKTCIIDPVACEGCGVCVRVCPEQVIYFRERLCGEWMVSDTRIGPLVHARLAVAAENSGKLVSTVRQEARRIAKEGSHPLVIVDGPPGIGCPVIASLTGASTAVVITEPTVSGEHDLERVLSLTRHFQIPTKVCVNKWDINPEMTFHIEDKARQAGARIVGRIRYDRSITKAQMIKKAVVETDAPCVEDIKNVWMQLGFS